MAERSTKRQKIVGGADAQLAALMAVQEKLNEQDKELADKMLELTREYATRKAPLYAERQGVTEAIPHFWSKVLLAYPPIEDILCDEDEDALKYLSSVMVEERDDPQEFKLVFNFAPNPYFKDAQLWKVISSASRPDQAEDGSDADAEHVGLTPYVVEASGIDWRNSKEANALRAVVEEAVGEKADEDDDNDDGSACSLFMLFHPRDPNATIIDMIRTEVFDNPTEWFNEDDVEVDDA